MAGRNDAAVTVPFLLALPGLAASMLLPPGPGAVVAVAVVVVLGVPHGALDVEVGRTLLRPHLPRLWFPAFGTPYLLLVAAVLLVWRAAPDATLVAFLLASVWHFGTEEAGGPGLAALARGGLPVAAPVLLQPGATAGFLSTVVGSQITTLFFWLTVASVAWLIPFALWAWRRRGRDLPEAAMLWGAFAVMPPLTAFAFYFAAVHAPAHTAILIRHATRAPRVVDHFSAWCLAAPTTLLTIAIAAAVWPLYAGPAPARLVCVTFQLLAAFTLPHMLFDGWLKRRDRIMRRQPAPDYAISPP